jgi:hypothetical protein
MAARSPGTASTPVRWAGAVLARGLVVLSALLVTILVLATPASAYWRSTGHGPGGGTTGTLAAPTGVTVPANTLSSGVAVTWTASTGSPAPTGYYVTRTSGGVTTPACGTSVSALLTGTSCTESGVTDGTYTYQAIAAYRSWTAASAPSGSVSVWTPAKVAFTGQPSNTVAGVGIVPSVAVTVETTAGVPIPLAGRSVTVAIGTNPGSGTLSGTLAGTTNSSGVVTFAGLSINKSGVGYTLTATSTGLTSATSGTFTITAAAADRLALTSAGVSGAAAASATLGPITVTIRDALGNAVNAPTGGTVVTLSSNSTGTARFAATSNGTTVTTVTIPAGSSSTDFFYGDTKAASPTITASGTGLTSATHPATITAASATKLAFTSAPISAGAASITANIGPLAVRREDAFGNPVITATADVVTLSSNSTGTARFAATSGGSTVTTVTILAGDSAVAFHYGDTKPGTPTITASDGTLTSATQVETIVVGAANKLVITSGSIDGVASEHAVRGPITVQVRDIADNPVTTGVVVSLSSNTAGTAVFSPTLDATTNTPTLTIPSGSSSGTFYYGDTRVGTSTVTAAVSGLTSANLPGVITHAVASQLVFGVQPTNTQKSHTFSPAPTARILDRFGNLVTTGTASTSSVTIAIGVNGGNILLGLGAGNLNGTQSVNAVAGVATFTNIRIDGGILNAGGEGNGYTFVVTDGTLTAATSTPFNITP